MILVNWSRPSRVRPWLATMRPRAVEEGIQMTPPSQWWTACQPDARPLDLQGREAMAYCHGRVVEQSEALRVRGERFLPAFALADILVGSAISKQVSRIVEDRGPVCGKPHGLAVLVQVSVDETLKRLLGGKGCQCRGLERFPVFRMEELVEMLLANNLFRLVAEHPFYGWAGIGVETIAVCLPNPFTCTFSHLSEPFLALAQRRQCLLADGDVPGEDEVVFLVAVLDVVDARLHGHVRAVLATVVRPRG